MFDLLEKKTVNSEVKVTHIYQDVFWSIVGIGEQEESIPVFQPFAPTVQRLL